MPGSAWTAAGLLSGTRGEQIAGRFSIVPRQPVHPRPGMGRADRRDRGQPAAAPPSAGTLATLAATCTSRTRGMIGSLLWLIRAPPSCQAILDGTEKITRKSLDQIAIDMTAQAPPPRTAPKR